MYAKFVFSNDKVYLLRRLFNMRYTEINTSYGNYSCPCGASRSSETHEYSTKGNPHGDVTILWIPYNLGDAYSYCEKCKKYWFDGNAQEWNKLSFTKKFFYVVGFWAIARLLPPWFVFRYVSEEGSENRFIRFFQYIYWTIIGIPFLILYNLFLILLLLVANVPFIPIVIIFHWIEIHASKNRIRNGSPNESKYYAQETDIPLNKMFPWM
jgi:hypothetical protein